MLNPTPETQALVQSLQDLLGDLLDLILAHDLPLQVVEKRHEHVQGRRLDHSKVAEAADSSRLVLIVADDLVVLLPDCPDGLLGRVHIGHRELLKPNLTGNRASGVSLAV